MTRCLPSNVRDRLTCSASSSLFSRSRTERCFGDEQTHDLLLTRLPVSYPLESLVQEIAKRHHGPARNCSGELCLALESGSSQETRSFNKKGQHEEWTHSTRSELNVGSILVGPRKREARSEQRDFERPEVARNETKKQLVQREASEHSTGAKDPT